jgi:hypothetical protein
MAEVRCGVLPEQPAQNQCPEIEPPAPLVQFTVGRPVSGIGDRVGRSSVSGERERVTAVNYYLDLH